METHETFEHAPTRPGLELNLQAQDFLREAAKWSGFLGIVGFILTAFILLSALFAGSILATIPVSNLHRTAAFGHGRRTGRYSRRCLRS